MDDEIKININEIIELSSILPPPIQLFFLRNFKKAIDLIKKGDKDAR